MNHRRDELAELEARLREARRASMAVRQQLLDNADRQLALPCLRDGQDFSFTDARSGQKIPSARLWCLLRRERAARELAELQLEELIAGDVSPAMN